MEKSTTLKISLIIVILAVFTGYGYIIRRAADLEMFNLEEAYLSPVPILLLMFGVYYAIHIAIEPFNPGWTWLSVVIGDAVTDGGSFCLLYLTTGNPIIAAIPVASHILTGVPMIVSQATKHLIQPDGVIVIEEED